MDNNEANMREEAFDETGRFPVGEQMVHPVQASFDVYGINQREEQGCSDRMPSTCPVSSISERLRTFPEDWCRIPSSDELAFAGFYYVGAATEGNGDDTLQCFRCDCRVEGWQMQDDPWVEHVKFMNGRCPHVLRCRGDTFVDIIRSGVEHHASGSVVDEMAGKGMDVLCRVCGKKKAETVFLPCRHWACCVTCSGSRERTVCPICSVRITGIIRA